MSLSPIHYKNRSNNFANPFPPKKPKLPISPTSIHRQSAIPLPLKTTPHPKLPSPPAPPSISPKH
ncbi:hypothetical protein EJ04DRAFT_368265 [Polyplosphaeria fusca]|uniref:Uncharacterized protein n=1 Tax=Polyplosphaeria fusca TaxID=682080 RepID=A0A9P4UZZ0_9PLEO|nr:hypothetical protein EJ04DRAFT_368265 [Polyplosphaeria fusca]